MPEKLLIVYGAAWCGDCIRTRRFLERNNIPFEWINIDHNQEGEAFVLKVNHGNRSIPTIVFPDGRCLTEPTNHQLALALQGSENNTATHDNP